VHLTGLDRFYWLAGFGAHLVLLAILLVRRHYRQFPVFTVYIAFNIARTCALYFVQSHGRTHEYFDAYWALGAVDTLLELGVVLEMYFRTFRPSGKWPGDLHGSFLTIGLEIAIVASGLTWLATPPTRLWTQAVVIRGSFFTSACLSGLFVAIVALSVRAGVPFHAYAQRILEGLGAYSIVDLLVESGHSLFGVGDTHLYAALSRVRVTAYLVCVLYWIGSLWRSTPPQGTMPERMRAQLIELQRVTAMELESVRLRRWP
jgi:hypothetical protein